MRPGSGVVALLSASWPALVILAYFGAAVMCCNPLYDAPLYDDWAYMDNVKRFLERGELRFIWTQVPFLGQLIGGALLVKLFGFSFGILHLWGLAWGILGTFGAYGLARAFGLARGLALLVALAMASMPPFLHLSFTFMTDVPARGSFLVLLATFAWGERLAEERPGRARALFLASGVIVAFSTTVRDFTFLFVLPLFAAWYLNRRLLAPWVLPTGVGLTAVSHAFMYTRVQMPYSDLQARRIHPSAGSDQARLRDRRLRGAGARGRGRRPAAVLRPARARPIVETAWPLVASRPCLSRGGDPPVRVVVTPCPKPRGRADVLPARIHLTLWHLQCLPAPGRPSDRHPLSVRFLLTALGIVGAAFLTYHALSYARALLERARHRKEAVVLTAALAVALAVLGAAGGVLPRVGVRLPLRGGSLGAGIEACLIFAGVMSGAVLWRRFARRRGSLASPIPLPLTTAGALVVGLAAFTYYVCSMKFFMRYLMAISPGVLCLLLARVQPFRPSRVLMGAGIAAWTATSLVWTHDQIAFNEARWAAGRWLHARGVPPDEVVGGFEFDAWFNGFQGPQPSPSHVRAGDVWVKPNYLLTRDTFRQTYRPVRGEGRGVRYWGVEYRRMVGLDVPVFPYRSILEGREAEVQIWRRYEPVR